MQVVIDIPEELYKANHRGLEAEELWNLRIAIKNGTPLEKHDEEVIKETVESIWGKPPYTEVLDKIRTEIEQLPTKTRTNWDGCCPDIDYPKIEYVDVTKAKLLKIIDKYKAESEDEG